MGEYYVKFSDIGHKNRHKGDDYSVMDIYNELKDLFLNAYEWRNLPKSIDERFLNLQLFNFGKIAFFKSDMVLGVDDVTSKRIIDSGQYFIGQPLSTGDLDIYNRPMNVRVTFGNGQDAGTYENNKELVYIYHSLAHDTPQLRLWEYANKIANAEMTIDQNINGQKTPYLVGVTKKNLSTFQKIFAKITNFQDTIYLSKDMGENAIQKTDIITPYVSDKVSDIRKYWYNEAVGYIGIESNVSEKNERLLRGELFVSNGKSIARRNAMLKSRRLGVNKINELWGIGLEVVATNPSIMDIMEVEDDNVVEEVDTEGGESNESI